MNVFGVFITRAGGKHCLGTDYRIARHWSAPKLTVKLATRSLRNTLLRVELRSTGQAEEAYPTQRRRQECRRCRHECPRHVRSNGTSAQMAKTQRRPERPPARSKASSWLESRMWGKMASCCRLVIGLYESSSTFMSRRPMRTGKIACHTKNRTLHPNWSAAFAIQIAIQIERGADQR